MDGKQTNTALRLVPSATPPSSAWLVAGLEDEVERRLGGTPYLGETGGL